MVTHIATDAGAWAGAWVIGAIIKLVAFAIDDRERWRRLLVLIFVLMAATAAAGWWLLGDGGLQILMHDFGPAGITRPRYGPR